MPRTTAAQSARGTAVPRVIAGLEAIRPTQTPARQPGSGTYLSAVSWRQPANDRAARALTAERILLRAAARARRWCSQALGRVRQRRLKTRPQPPGTQERRRPRICVSVPTRTAPLPLRASAWRFAVTGPWGKPARLRKKRDRKRRGAAAWSDPPRRASCRVPSPRVALSSAADAPSCIVRRGFFCGAYRVTKRVSGPWRGCYVACAKPARKPACKHACVKPKNNFDKTYDKAARVDSRARKCGACVTTHRGGRPGIPLLRKRGDG